MRQIDFECENLTISGLTEFGDKSLRSHRLHHGLLVARQFTLIFLTGWGQI